MDILILKKRLLILCFILNLLVLALYMSLIIAAIFSFSAYVDYIFFDAVFIKIRMVLAIPIFILWINSLIIWAKKDKHIGRFIFLFFFIGIYSPFYFIKILKNKWQ